MEIAGGTAVMLPVGIPHGADSEIGCHGHIQVRAVDEFFVRMPTPEAGGRSICHTEVPAPFFSAESARSDLPRSAASEAMALSAGVLPTP
jgi:hypothetical protein